MLKKKKKELKEEVVAKPLVEKVESKEEKKADGVRVMVRQNG
jgi:hypothetical protein